MPPMNINKINADRSKNTEHDFYVGKTGEQ